MKNDMTTGKIYPKIIYFAIFIFFGNLFQQLYNVIDSFIVGNVNGENALAAISVTGPIVFMFIGLLLGISAGFGIKMSHIYGAKKYDLLRKYYAMSMLLSFILGISMSIILLILNKFILNFINTPKNIFNKTYIYIAIIYSGIIFTMFYNLCSSTLRAIGNSKIPLIFLIISSIINIVLDIICVYFLKMGVFGAAFATVISQCFSVIISINYIFKKYEFLKIHTKDFKLDKNIIIELLTQGIPMGLQFSVTAFGIMFVQMELNKYGSEYIAGFGVAGKFQAIVLQLFIALGVAIANFIGQNYGAKNFDRIKLGIKYSTFTSIFLSLVAFIIIKFSSDFFVLLFVPDASEVMRSASKIYFNCVMYFYPFLALLFVYRNGLQGFGRADLSVLGGVFEVIARVGVILLFSEKYGYIGVCFSDSLAWIFALIPLIPLFFIVYKKEIIYVNKL